MDQFNGETWFKGAVFRDFSPRCWMPTPPGPYENLFEPDGVRRDRFELQITRTDIKFGMPDYDLWWIDTAMPASAGRRRVVQLGHHSYNPRRRRLDVATARSDTWHWDNVSISTAGPFTILNRTRPASTRRPDPGSASRRRRRRVATCASPGSAAAST